MEGHGHRDPYGPPASQQPQRGTIPDYRALEGRSIAGQYGQSQAQQPHTPGFGGGPEPASQRPESSGWSSYRAQSQQQQQHQHPHQHPHQQHQQQQPHQQQQQQQYAGSYQGQPMPYAAGFGSDPAARQQNQYQGLIGSSMQSGIAYGLGQAHTGYESGQHSYGSRQQGAVGNPSAHYQVQSFYPQDYSTSLQSPSAGSAFGADELPFASPSQYSARREVPHAGYAAPIDYPQPQPFLSMQPPAIPAVQEEVESRRPNSSYREYLQKLRESYEQIAQAQLHVAGPSLLDASKELLDRVEELGLSEDDDKKQGQRRLMWIDFNNCWLAFMQKLKEMLELVQRTGQLPQNQTFIEPAFLEEMGEKLIAWADGLERFGLVDYETGIWEEEILDIAGECRTLFASQPELFAEVQHQPP